MVNKKKSPSKPVNNVVYFEAEVERIKESQAEEKKLYPYLDEEEYPEEEGVTYEYTKDAVVYSIIPAVVGKLERYPKEKYLKRIKPMSKAEIERVIKGGNKPLYCEPNKPTFPYGKCPKCFNALKRKQGRFGEFLGCCSYPKCDYTANVPEDDSTQGDLA